MKSLKVQINAIISHSLLKQSLIFVIYEYKKKSLVNKVVCFKTMIKSFFKFEKQA